MRVLVVGADGLIGKCLSQSLREVGHEVLGTSRRPSRDLFRLDLAQADEFSIPSDLCVAFICAGIGSLDKCAQEPKATALVNVTGTADLAKRLADAGTNVVYLSTSLVFDGAKPAPDADDPVSPCCEYGRQKAELEAKLRGGSFACVRLTKVIESLAARFRNWKSDLLAGKRVAAPEKLRFSPISLDETVSALVGLAETFQPGVFQISGDQDFSYRDAASKLAAECGLSTELVAPDEVAGSGLFEPVPVFATLKVRGPANSSCWRFSPASVTLERFTRRYAAN